MNGGTSGGSPGSENSTSSGASGPLDRLLQPRLTEHVAVAERASPGGATLRTTGVSAASTPARSTRKVRLECRR